MEERTKIHVGLDVHKDSITVAVADPGREKARLFGKVVHDVPRLLKVLAKIGAVEDCTSSMKPDRQGSDCNVHWRARGMRARSSRPSKTPRQPGNRVKTDARDSLALAEYSRAGKLSGVWIPDPEDEAIRDLSRAREDAVISRKQARQQLKGFLLRHDRRYGGKTVLVCSTRALAGPTELWTRCHADGIHRVLAGREVRRRACPALDHGAAEFDRGLAL